MVERGKYVRAKDVPVEEAVSTELLEKGFRHLHTNINRIQSFLDDGFAIRNLDTRDVLHRHDAVRCVLGIGLGDANVPELGAIKVLSEAIAILELIQIVNLFVEQAFVLFKDTNPIALGIPIQETTF